MFKEYHPVLGNHDTNYQGKETASSENYTGQLTQETINALWFKRKAYYSFDGANSKCYVFDSGIEHNSMTAYDWEQIDWFGNALKDDDAEHSIIFIHMIKESNSETFYVLANNISSIVAAYNNHSTVTLNGIQYDFTECTGKIEFWTVGHTHQDATGTLGGIPYFTTKTNGSGSNVPVVDLALVDYGERKVYLTRCGSGADRIINLT
jgi:hypothetical protein